MLKVGQMRQMIEGCHDNETIHVVPNWDARFMSPIGQGVASATILINGQRYETDIVEGYPEVPVYPEVEEYPKSDSIESRADRLTHKTTLRTERFEFIVSKVTYTKVTVCSPP